MRWSSSTAPISPTAWRGGCAAAAPSIPIIDYVSPTVWAWRPGRAAAMRRYVDHVLALLPFEPEAHRTARRARHAPMSAIPSPSRWRRCARIRGSSAARCRPSGRPGPAGEPPRRDQASPRHLRRGDGRGVAAHRRRRDVLPTVPHLVDEVARAIARLAGGPRIVVEPAENGPPSGQARAALAASGTVTLELALAGVPTVTAYRVALFEEVIARARLTGGLRADPRQSHSSARTSCRNSCSGTATPQNLADALRAAHRRYSGAAAASRGLWRGSSRHGGRRRGAERPRCRHRARHGRASDPVSVRFPARFHVEAAC